MVEQVEEPKPIIYTANVWRTGGKWIIPIPKHLLPLLKKNTLYKLEITIRECPINLNIKGKGHAKYWEVLATSTAEREEQYTEITKIWKLGNKYGFPIRREIADLLVPKIREIKTKVKEAVELSKIERAKEKLLKENEEYQKLKEELELINRSRLVALLEFMEEEPNRDKEEIEKKMKEIEEKATKEAPKKAKTLKPNYDELQLLAWAKRPLKVKVTLFEVKDPEEAIELYRKAPFGLD